MQSKQESFLAFFSYVQGNDEHDRGRLTDLRKLLQNEIWAQTGKPFKIFQDYENIEWGEDWKQRIKCALDSSPLLIAIITPSYLESQSCEFEFEYFLQRETKLNRKLILPILYIETPRLRDKNNKIAIEVSKRQWVDWRDLRFVSPTSIKVSRKIEALAKQIRDLVDEDFFSELRTKPENEYQLPESIVRETKEVHSSETTVNPNSTLPSLYAPTQQDKELAYPLKHITVLFGLTDDRERNKRRIKILHSTLTSFKGRDRFSFQIFEKGKMHLIDFPNDTTRVCPEVLTRLKKLLGEESWRIKEITFP